MAAAQKIWQDMRRLCRIPYWGPSTFTETQPSHFWGFHQGPAGKKSAFTLWNEIIELKSLWLEPESWTWTRWFSFILRGTTDTTHYTSEKVVTWFRGWFLHAVSASSVSAKEEIDWIPITLGCANQTRHFHFANSVLLRKTWTLTYRLSPFCHLLQEKPRPCQSHWHNSYKNYSGTTGCLNSVILGIF